MLRIKGAESDSEVFERILDHGIVVEPWASVCLGEPSRLRNYHWVAESKSNLRSMSSYRDDRRGSRAA